MSRLRTTVSGGLGILAMIATAAIASAHAQYQSSAPPANGTLTAAPATVQVTWTEELASIQFTVTGPGGSNVVNGPATIDLEERTNASVPIKDAGPGQYTVVWHNVSGDDGDPNDGSFVFTVAGTPASATPSPTPAAAAASNPPPAAGTKPAPASPGCVENGQVTPGQADFRVNTYCKRQAIRDQYRGQIDELVFNFDLSNGMGLESALKDALGGGED